MADNNKTHLTNVITAGAKMWMLGVGFKPVQDEVPVADGWVADVAGYIQPTQTELTRHLKLLKALGLTNDESGVAKFFSRYEMPMTGLIEVKTTKADYKKDIGRKYARHDQPSCPVHLPWLAYPTGMVPDLELPHYWGLLEFSANGDKLLKARCPVCVRSQHPGDTAKVIANIGERIFNKYQDPEMAEWLKEHRAEQREKEIRWRTSAFLMTIQEQLSGVDGGFSLAQKFKHHKIPLTDNQVKICDEIESALKVKTQ